VTERQAVFFHNKALMALQFSSLRRLVLGISIDVMDKFWNAYSIPDTTAKRELRYTSTALVDGYNMALEQGLSPKLMEYLQTFELDLLGFAYKGAGMGLALLDYLSPGNQRRFQQFVADNPAHVQVVHIGAGIIMSVLKRDAARSMADLLPFNRWWAVDGFGFYDGVSNWKRSLEQQAIPKQFKGYARRGFDQGLGRSIWFLYSVDLDNVVKQIHCFSPTRHADLWSGVGLASTYTGGVDRTILEAVKAAAGDYASDVAVGSALAANGRYLAKNIVDHTNLASSVFCGATAEEAAKLTLRVKEALTIDPNEPVETDLPIYEIYRQGIRAQMTNRLLAV
jgi:enediyne biosynthesis protein E3